METSIRRSLSEPNKVEIWKDGEQIGESYVYQRTVKINGEKYEVLGSGRTQLWPEWRGLGLGRRFFEMLRDMAFNRGKSFIVGFCDDERMASMYRHLGWRVGEEKIEGKYPMVLNVVKAIEKLEKLEIEGNVW